MDKYSLYAGQFLPFTEYFKGHNACKGSGSALAFRHVYKALDMTLKNKTMVPWEKCTIERSNLSSAGIQPHMLCIPKGSEENGNMLYVYFDTEKTDKKIDSGILIKRMPAVAGASGYAYVATAAPSHPFDLVDKIKNAWDAEGHALIHILCPCPETWGFDPENTVRIARIAVETKVFPLYEIAHGYYQITVDEPNTKPVKDYIKRQDRFAKWKAKDISALQEEVNTNFRAIKSKASKGA